MFGARKKKNKWPMNNNNSDRTCLTSVTAPSLNFFSSPENTPSGEKRDIGGKSERIVSFDQVIELHENDFFSFHFKMSMVFNF